jgi:hypothetical protein
LVGGLRVWRLTAGARVKSGLIWSNAY